MHYSPSGDENRILSLYIYIFIYRYIERDHFSAGMGITLLLLLLSWGVIANLYSLNINILSKIGILWHTQKSPFLGHFLAQFYPDFVTNRTEKPQIRTRKQGEKRLFSLKSDPKNLKKVSKTAAMTITITIE